MLKRAKSISNRAKGAFKRLTGRKKLPVVIATKVDDEPVATAVDDEPVATAEAKKEEPKKDEVDNAEMTNFRNGLTELIKGGDYGDGEDGAKKRDNAIAGFFDKELQKMILNGILVEIEKKKGTLTPATMDDLKRRMAKAKKAGEMQWPIPNMEDAWTVHDGVYGLFKKAKKAADDLTEIFSSVMVMVMAQAKAFAAVGQLVEVAINIVKEDGVNIMKDGLPNLIKLKLLKYAALMQGETIDSTKKFEDGDMESGVKKVNSGFAAVGKAAFGAAKGGSRRRRKRGTQHYRSKFRASRDQFW